jgi:hypothetical protein
MRVSFASSSTRSAAKRLRSYFSRSSRRCWPVAVNSPIAGSRDTAGQQPVPGLVALADRFGTRDMADAAVYDAAVRRLIGRARRSTSRVSTCWRGCPRATPPWRSGSRTPAPAPTPRCCWPGWPRTLVATALAEARQGAPASAASTRHVNWRTWPRQAGGTPIPRRSWRWPGRSTVTWPRRHSVVARVQRCRQCRPGRGPSCPGLKDRRTQAPLPPPFRTTRLPIMHER